VLARREPRTSVYRLGYCTLPALVQFLDGTVAVSDVGRGISAVSFGHAVREVGQGGFGKYIKLTIVGCR
jgi:hypothetical protein